MLQAGAMQTHKSAVILHPADEHCSIQRTCALEAQDRIQTEIVLCNVLC